MGPLIPITMFVCIAAVMILRPLTKRLGHLLEAITRDRTPQVQDNTSARTIALLEHLNRRLDLMEERLDFTERLVSARTPELRSPTQRSPVRAVDMETEYLTR